MFDPGNFEFKKLVERFEQMLNQGEEYFFDVEDFEQISDYYLQYGKEKQALRALNIAIGQHPFSAELLIRRAGVFLDVQKLKDAHNDLLQAESLDPENADLLMTRAEWHSKRGQHNKAIQKLKKAADILGSFEEVNILLAQEYLELANYRKAAEYFKQVLLDDYDDGSALFSLSFCYDMLGKNNELIVFLKKFIDDNPYSEIAWHQLGLVYQKDKQYEKAIEAFDFACLIDEFFSASHYEKARAYELLGRYDKAIDIYNDLLEIEDFNAYAYLRIGMAYREMGKNAQAKRYFDKANREDPDMEDILLNIVNLHEEEEEWREAVYFVRKLTKLSNTPGFLFYSALIHHKAGLIDEAIEILMDLFKRDDCAPEVHLMYSDLMFELERFTDGIDVLYLGIESFPDNAEIYLRLGIVLFQLNDIDQSHIFLKRAIDLDRPMVDEFMDTFPDIKNDPNIFPLLN
jgi:tetratricopeptide (TPR) repeat protein